MYRNCTQKARHYTFGFIKLLLLFATKVWPLKYSQFACSFRSHFNSSKPSDTGYLRGLTASRHCRQKKQLSSQHLTRQDWFLQKYKAKLHLHTFTHLHNITCANAHKYYIQSHADTKSRGVHIFFDPRHLCSGESQYTQTTRTSWSKVF